jgi:ferric iron reductase protein FhuF
MATRTAQAVEPLLWRASLSTGNVTLADAIREKIAETRAHLLDFIKLDEPHPHHAMTLAQWRTPVERQSLFAAYSNHIYRNQPTMARENKPLLSLWAQWYVGLMVPPMMLALLTQDAMLDLSPEFFHVEFHETGRAACFWIDLHEDKHAGHLSAQQRMESLVTRALIPVIDALEETGEINGKLIWSNTGYLIHWYLTEMKPLLGDEKVEALRQSCFFAKQLSDGCDNPLFRTVVPRDGLLVRRTCCQRYRLPDVQQCGDCTLK